jgi:CRP-like cAMP-binding protein
MPESWFELDIIGQGQCIFQQKCPKETEVISLPRGRTIMMREQKVSHVYHLHKGIAAGVLSFADGHELTGLFVPPLFLGLGGFVDMYKGTQTLHLAEVRAITPVTFCRVKREVVWELLDDRTVRSEILNMIYENYLTSIVLTGSHMKDAVSNRVLYVLQAIARAACRGDSRCSGQISDISQDELAFLCNTTRPSATRILTRLEKAGLIEVRRRQIIVKNLRKFLSYTSVSDI